MPSNDEGTDPRPKTLFHYTDARGLLGILTTHTLWATEFRFLNDEQEATYARELFVSGLRNLPNPALDPGHVASQWPEDFGRTFDTYRGLVEEDLGSTKFPVFVTCFCEAGDLLSQWRAYGTDHGYAIEFDTDALERAVVAERDRNWIEHARTERVQQGWMVPLAQVRYGPQAATDVVASAMRGVSADSNLGHVGTHASWMASNLTAMLARIKHPGFAEEREWRAILGFAPWDTADEVKFRETGIAIAPYRVIPFENGLVVSVTVGPGRHAPVRRGGVTLLLQSIFGPSPPPVLTSEVPLRS